MDQDISNIECWHDLPNDSLELEPPNLKSAGQAASQEFIARFNKGLLDSAYGTELVIGKKALLPLFITQSEDLARNVEKLLIKEYQGIKLQVVGNKVVVKNPDQYI